MSLSKPSARRGRDTPRPSARVPVASGVFAPKVQAHAPLRKLEPAEPAPQADRPPHAEPVTGTRPRPSLEGAVLVTGICGRLGKLLARELHRTEQVVGVDRRAFPDRPKDVVHHQVDMRRKKMKDIFRGRNIRAVVHLGVLHDPRRSDRERHSWNIVAFQKLLDYMSQYEVPKLVVLSGANVYGPQANNPQFLGEDAPLLGAQHFGGMRDLVELDMLAQSFFWKHPDTETVILRPCHIVGRVHNAASNYLRLERPVMVMGFDPMMQLVHEKDVVRAIQLALRPGVRGIFNIRGPGEMPLSHLVRKAGGRPRVVPSPIAKIALDQLWKLRLSSFPSQELDHLRYVCMVDDSRARAELGYEPVHSIERVLRDVRRLRYQVA
jgi:UDP-glucose 4-epimerase